MVPPKVYGNLLQHLTGSKHHNVALREAAVRAGLKVSEYGIEEAETGDVLACEHESDVYARLGMTWIPPELRENRGEIEAARKDRLPALVEIGQIRGDLHMHTDWSDGKATLEKMVEAARARGYGYVNVTDHSPSVGFGMGLDAGRLRDQVERVRTLAEKLAPDFTLLAGAEVDILRDGSLDYSDELLSELDVVVASVHASHRLSSADQTKRICAALENPHVDILGHPTGRRIGTREPQPARHRGGDREGGRDPHDHRGELAARAARPARHPRPACGRGRGAARRQHRRPLGGGARLSALRRRHRSSRLGDGRRRHEHARMARAQG